ncbi:zona pellucida sperm-binding protein 3-like [Embiotoca jacksoni]|uniref:zona pellucida sperm-binding protein 3-like n=1 Tax=Embiotoca jacksoni TaxID=100190 RepID=UPI0037042503
MAFFWLCVVLVSLVASVAVNADMKLDCGADYVTVVWTESRSQANTSLFRLGSCFPTSSTAREAVFSVYFNDCSFRSLVTGNHMIYTNDLTFISSPGSLILPFSHPVVCAYERSKDWYPMIYEPVFDTYGVEDLVFHIGLMNADFSGPAEFTTFALGSVIPIMASVEQHSHQPLLLFLEECVAATTPALEPESHLYPLITNKGCLVDSKVSRSKFEQREKSSELRLSLQAFKFALGEELFIHCTLVVWEPNSLDHTKKACHYGKDHGWELLDNPAHSSSCDCCESICRSRKTRSLSGMHGVRQQSVLGPLTITDQNS